MDPGLHLHPVSANPMLACFPTMIFCQYLDSVQTNLVLRRKLDLDLLYASLASMSPALEHCYNPLCAWANVLFGTLCCSTVLILLGHDAGIWGDQSVEDLPRLGSSGRMRCLPYWDMASFCYWHRIRDWETYRSLTWWGMDLCKVDETWAPTEDWNAEAKEEGWTKNKRDRRRKTNGRKNNRSLRNGFDRELPPRIMLWQYTV